MYSEYHIQATAKQHTIYSQVKVKPRQAMICVIPMMLCVAIKFDSYKTETNREKKNDAHSSAATNFNKKQQQSNRIHSPTL